MINLIHCLVFLDATDPTMALNHYCTQRCRCCRHTFQIKQAAQLRLAALGSSTGGFLGDTSRHGIRLYRGTLSRFCRGWRAYRVDDQVEVCDDAIDMLDMYDAFLRSWQHWAVSHSSATKSSWHSMFWVHCVASWRLAAMAQSLVASWKGNPSRRAPTTTMTGAGLLYDTVDTLAK
jgi:hypothetical protein